MPNLSLIDFPFIPAVGGRLSLEGAFRTNTPGLAGDPQLQIIAMKLLLAVAQSALRLDPRTPPQAPSFMSGLGGETLIRKN